MIVKDPEIIKLIQELGEHYRNNINNKYVKKAYLNLTLDMGDFNRIESFTEEANYAVSYEYGFNELYERILSLARFVHDVKSNILPNLRGLAGSAEGPQADKEKILRDIALNNFPANLGILSDMVHQLFIKIFELDKRENGESTPFFNKNPDLKEIGQLLIE